MPRYRMTVEYDGTPYVGWQKQDNGHSVQAAIENAILALTRETVLVRGAGRTDSGVHAMGQVVHADLSKTWPPQTLRNALNAYLGRAGERVVILDAAEVDENFDARFSAHRRHYLYRILSRKAPLALEAKRAWWVSKDIDHSAMHAAAQQLVGYHDFTTFRSIHCQANSPLRTLDRLDVTRTGNLIEIRATAQSFLHNQIRSFAGTVKMVGEGKWRVEDVATALAARDRRACGPVAPPEGLYFMQVDYPTDPNARRIRQSEQVRPS
jgi:tRNA pseudouridine38-40 synthase